MDDANYNHKTTSPTPWSRALLSKLTVPTLVKKYPPIFWNPKFHCRIHKIPLTVPILSQINLVNVHPSHFSKNSFNIILPSVPKPTKWPLSRRFPHQILHTPLLSPIRATCHAHLILLDLITRTILGEEYRSLSSSFCSFLHSPVTSFS